jgi:hypothetical protein
MLEKSSSARGQNADLNTLMFSAPMEALQFWQPVMSAAVEWNGRIFEVVTTLNKVWLDLVNRRFEQDMALQQHLWGCKTLEDVWGVCNEYSQKAVNDYQRGFAEIARLGAGPQAS